MNFTSTAFQGPRRRRCRHVAIPAASPFPFLQALAYPWWLSAQVAAPIARRRSWSGFITQLTRIAVIFVGGFPPALEPYGALRARWRWCTYPSFFCTANLAALTPPRPTAPPRSAPPRRRGHPLGV